MKGVTTSLPAARERAMPFTLTLPASARAAFRHILGVTGRPRRASNAAHDAQPRSSRNTGMRKVIICSGLPVFLGWAR